MHTELVFLTNHPLCFNYHQKLQTETWAKKHSHEGLELLYIHQGTGTISINNEIYRIKPHTLFIAQPFQHHQIAITPHTEYVRSVLLIAPSHVLTYLTSLPLHHLLLSMLIKYPLSKQIFTLDDTYEEFEQLLYKMHTALDTCYSNEENELFVIFLSQILQHIKKNLLFEYNLQNTSYILSILDWVDSHLHTSCSLTELSTYMNLSTFYISHLVKDSLGINFSQYIAKKRLEKAILMLCNNEDSLKDIAIKIGISNPTYFSTWFKKHTGYSPKVYRNTFKTNNSFHFFT